MNDKQQREATATSNVEKAEEHATSKRLRPLPPEYTTLNIAGCMSASRSSGLLQYEY